ncbi:MAG: hypothetical protein Kow0079_15990 [Vicingaceae bacterium]
MNKLIYILALYVFIAIKGYAQTPEFKEYNVNEGLPQSSVTDIYQDHRGYLWIGTAGGGVAIFDGLHFEEFGKKEKLSNEIIKSISRDKNNNILIVTNWNGIIKYDGKRIRKLNKENGFPINSCNKIFLINNDNWFVYPDGIVIYDGQSTKLFNENNGLLSNNVRDIFVDKQQNIFISTDKGIQYISKKDTLIIDEKHGLISNNITIIRQDYDDNYWVGTQNNGLIKLLKGSFEQNEFCVYEHVIKNSEQIKTILVDIDKQTWVGTNNGIYIIDKNQNIQHLNENNGLTTNQVDIIIEDRSSNIWIGTWGAGLLKHVKTPFTSFRYTEGLNNKNIFTIIEDQDYNLWVGTISNGLYMYDGEKVIYINEKFRLPYKSINASYLSKDNTLYFGTSEDLIYFKNNRFYSINEVQNAKVIIEDKNGYLWVGTYGNGLYKLKNNKVLKRYTRTDGLTFDYIYSLAEDNNNNLWIGTGNGLNKFDGERFINYNNVKAFCNLYIGSMAFDNFGNLWMGTDQCVMHYDGVDFKSFTEDDGLNSNVVYSVVKDSDGNIWVGTNRGVNEISFNSYGQVKKIKSFGQVEGFHGVECNSRAVFVDHKKNIYWGTVNGLIKYNPLERRTNLSEPIVHLNKIKLFYEEPNWNKYTVATEKWNNLPRNLTLPYNKNHITFEFSAISLTMPERIEYSFILEGFDKDWSPPSNKNSITYSNLPPGKYTFKVKAKNNDNIWSEQPVTFSFTIEKAWYYQWWFIVIVFLFFVFILYEISTYKEKKQQRINEELERLVIERTQLISKQKDEKEILLKEIHHRVKNNLQIIISLLNIQSSFIKDEKVINLLSEAQNRIRSMAIIHEKMYQSKDLSHIRIDDYIISLANDLLKAYALKTNDIELIHNIPPYKFSIDTLIPLGLLLNEIITNSLKYAFEENQKEKIIEITIKKLQGDQFQLIIGDNGKGYDKEEFLKENKSLGLELIKVFTDQIDGTIEIMDKKGTYYKIVFKGTE